MLFSPTVTNLLKTTLNAAVAYATSPEPSAAAPQLARPVHADRLLRGPSVIHRPGALPAAQPENDGALFLAALVSSMYMAVTADGELDDSEYAQLLQVTSEITNGMCSPEQVETLLDAVDQQLELEGEDAAISDIARLIVDPELRRHVMTATVAVVIAGDQNESKAGFVHRLGTALGISHEELEAHLERCSNELAS